MATPMGEWVPVEDALPKPDTMVEVILVANLEHFGGRVPESHWIDVLARWIATRRWDAPQCGRDPGGWKLVDRLGERWDVGAVVAWRELPPLGREWEELMAEDSRIVGEICGWGREPEEVSDGVTD